MEIDVRDLGLDCRQTTYGGAPVTDTPMAPLTDGGSFLVESGTGIAQAASTTGPAITLRC
jgi:hypothetical protein